MEQEINNIPYANVMEELSLEGIMDQYGTDVWNYAFFLTKDTEMADDISQEVFMKCYNNIESFRGTSTLKTWLLSITRNTAFSYKRSRYFRAKSIIEILLTPHSGEFIDRESNVASAENEYLAQEYVNEIWDVIMKLPDKFREVLVLDLKYDLSIDEICELMGIAAGTVKSRLYRARKKVQAEIRGLE